MYPLPAWPLEGDIWNLLTYVWLLYLYCTWIVSQHCYSFKVSYKYISVLNQFVHIDLYLYIIYIRQLCFYTSKGCPDFSQVPLPMDLNDLTDYVSLRRRLRRKREESDIQRYPAMVSCQRSTPKWRRFGYTPETILPPKKTTVGFFHAENARCFFC